MMRHHGVSQPGSQPDESQPGPTEVLEVYYWSIMGEAEQAVLCCRNGTRCVIHPTCRVAIFFSHSPPPARPRLPSIRTTLTHSILQGWLIGISIQSGNYFFSLLAVQVSPLRLGPPRFCDCHPTRPPGPSMCFSVTLAPSPIAVAEAHIISSKSDRANPFCSLPLFISFCGQTPSRG
ncbi:hypothetical protein GQ53DRAFT_390236 [Thozetella sp. PMI_491]|nr:hypothetical protein GQ53DRAFT_390236 [Thozetella sp. PMI_491]